MKDESRNQEKMKDHRRFCSSFLLHPSQISREIDGPLRVENEEQAVFQLVGAENQFSGRSLERLGGTLEQLLRDFQHVADLIDEQADRAVVGVNDHVDRLLIRGPFLQFE